MTSRSMRSALRADMRSPLSAALRAALLTLPAFATVPAQDLKIAPPRRVPSELVWTMPSDRAVLGVTLGASTRSDTGGVRVEDVDDKGPAAKAGLKAGDVITEINGVSLRVSAADADDATIPGLAQRRLQRAMAKAKPGDDVELRVRSGGAARSVRIKTVAASELSGDGLRAMRRTANRDDQHGVIGVSIGAAGNVRDTLGLFISSVTSAGPAEKAGVIEGERVAAVNGVDVRVPKEDIEDGTVATARVNRFVREVQKVAPGGTVSLRVFGNGRYRDVSVQVVKASEVPSQNWNMSVGDGGVRILRGSGATPPESESLDLVLERLRDRMQQMGRDLGRDSSRAVRIVIPRVTRTPPEGAARIRVAPPEGLTRM